MQRATNPGSTSFAHGFTLIEVLIVVAIVGILASAVFGIATGKVSASGNSVSFGFNGVTETRCISGYKFVIGEGGQARQVQDEFGKGVRCD